MSTECWIRNPDLYMREVVEVGVKLITWDRGLLYKKRINPAAHADLYFESDVDYRLLLMGDQGAAELRRGHDEKDPVAVYPVWQYGQDWSLLEEIVAEPVGEDESICSDMTVPPDERPVLGQEHRVVIIEPPVASSGPGRRFLTQLRELQLEYPECIIHVHGLYSYRAAFGLGFRAADMECRTLARAGKVVLPSGKEMRYEQTMRCAQWVTLLGYNVSDLKVPRNRCMYNIKSAVWAAENFEEVIKFRTSGGSVDPESPTHVPSETKSHLSNRTKASDGDKFTCDTCTLQHTCKYAREGSICTVPGSEPASLAKLFGSRDSDTVLAGMAALLEANAKRFKRGMDDETEYGEIDPEVTKIAALLLKGAKDYAKLIDPALRAGPTTAIQINGAGSVSGSVQVTPNQIMATIVAELEGRGIARAAITPSMIEGVLSAMASGQTPAGAIEATVLSERAG